MHIQAAIGDRALPCDLDAEEALLGAMLLRKDAIAAALETGVAAGDFFKIEHGDVFEAVTKLAAQGEPADVVTVADELRRAGVLDRVGGPGALVSLQIATPATSSAGCYARIVRSKARHRLRHRATGELREAALGEREPAPWALEAFTRPVADDGLFRRWTTGDLVDEDHDLRWLVRGLVTRATYGMLAGEMKTLKTHVAAFMAVSVAAGVPVFGHFAVDEPAPVLVYVGEGGRGPYTRLLQRVADAIGVDLRSIPLETSFDIAPITSPRFQASLQRDLAEVRPGLVILDPYYAFHGSAADARNLHEEAEVLNALSRPYIEAGAALNVVNHFNQSGGGRGLRRITMAGGGEWADSWWLLSRREDPDVPAGRFHLLLEVGSRQWGGSSHDLDFELGAFDEEANEHKGVIGWSLARHVDEPGGGEAAEFLCGILGDRPYELTQTQLVESAGMRKDEVRATLRRLEKAGQIVSTEVGRLEGKRVVRRTLFALSGADFPEEVGAGLEEAIEQGPDGGAGLPL
ncbi:MAG: DnaB-like helicase N-terminal domain-containing protein [Solirubrobacterales bacterium]